MDILLADNTQRIIAVILLFSVSVIFRFLLIAIGQQWVKTFSHTATLVSLPIITYVITAVISGNIALSLGMVGALSIVRFRNPVRSPFELAVYFANITMGIAASVSLKWFIFFIASMTMVIIGLIIIDKLQKIFTKKSMYEISFSEGNELSTLEIESTEEIKEIKDSNLLISENYTDNKYTYILVSSNFRDLKDISSSYNNHELIVRKNLNK